MESVIVLSSTGRLHKFKSSFDIEMLAAVRPLMSFLLLVAYKTLRRSCINERTEIITLNNWKIFCPRSLLVSYLDLNTEIKSHRA